jgi:Na+-transporting methylmalonyl-CoA/oxaloacetate decarboxylase beta subunit
VFGLLESGFQHFYWGNAVVLAIGGLFIYLGVARKMEPLLLVPIGFGMILVNLPLGGVMDYQLMVRAPEEGYIVQVPMEQGDKFEKGDILFELDSIEVEAPVFGRIEEIKVSSGQQVKAGQVLASVLTM